MTTPWPACRLLTSTPLEIQAWLGTETARTCAASPFANPAATDHITSFKADEPGRGCGFDRASSLSYYHPSGSLSGAPSGGLGNFLPSGGLSVGGTPGILPRPAPPPDLASGWANYQEMERAWIGMQEGSRGGGGGGSSGRLSRAGGAKTWDLGQRLPSGLPYYGPHARSSSIAECAMYADRSSTRSPGPLAAGLGSVDLGLGVALSCAEQVTDATVHPTLRTLKP